MQPVTLITWNVNGNNFVKTPAAQRAERKTQINQDIATLIAGPYGLSPDIIVLQEIVRYEEDGVRRELVDALPGYHYQSFIAIDSWRQSHPAKWDPIRRQGGWPDDAYIGQGYGILWRKEIGHCPIWELSRTRCAFTDRLAGEGIRVDAEDAGFFTGNRDTEPRLAVVSHFILERETTRRRVFVVNLHFTTLKGEREGFPERDIRGAEMRASQLETVLKGIVSRYNDWRRLQGPPHADERILWILAGDFNATPESSEIQRLMQLNFVDLCPKKGYGTKRHKNEETASITVDYIFAGSRYHAFRPDDLKMDRLFMEPVYHLHSSDHYPVVARFYLPPNPVDKAF